MDVDKFLKLMESNDVNHIDTVTVNTKELYNLLKAKRDAMAKVEQLKYENELLMLRNVELKQELTNLRIQKSIVHVSGIDIKA